MSISINGGMDLDSFRLQAQSSANTNKADRIANAAGNLSADSTDEELTEAVKSFESYFVEQILKQFQETKQIFGADSEDSSISMMSDMYLDSTISDLAKQLVDQYGGNLTEQLVEHMKLSYGMTTQSVPKAAEEQSADLEHKQDEQSDQAADNTKEV